MRWRQRRKQPHGEMGMPLKVRRIGKEDPWKGSFVAGGVPLLGGRYKNKNPVS